MRSLNLLNFLFLLRKSVGESWDGCYDAANPDANVQKNMNTQVCFTTGPGGDWGQGVDYKRYSFKPVADEYSKFTVPGSYNNLVENATDDITVFTSSQKGLSFQRKYFDSQYGVFPHLTAIIDVRNGIVQGIAWDDACVFCGDNRCKENTYKFDGSPASLSEPTKGCYLTQAQCSSIHDNAGTDCDLTIHVVWTGTDKNGRYLTSSNNRFSSFQPKQIQDYFKDSVTKWIPSFDFGGFFG